MDANNNGWQVFFNPVGGGTIAQSGEIDAGAYTELEAQNVIHGRLEQYLHTSTDVWLADLTNSGTVTVLKNTPGLVAVQTVSVDTTWNLRWVTTYYIWPDGEIYILHQVTNTGSSALQLNGSNPTELDFGGFALTYYQDQAPDAWYEVNNSVSSPIPFAGTSDEPQLFAHMPTSGNIDLGYLMDKYNTWASQGASNAGMDETNNTYRAKDEWFGTLSSLKSGQTLTFMFLLDQKRLLTQAQSINIDADYRAPSLAVNAGTLATSDNEPVNVSLNQGFNLDIGAYVVAANANHVNAQLGLPTGVTVRSQPRFKVTNWTKGAPTLTWGGQTLTAGTDYTYTLNSATNTLYIQLDFDVVTSNAQAGQRLNAALDIS
jgi:hypothetical protein